MEEFEEVELARMDIASINGVDILEAGVWIDASGRRVEIKETDIDEMIVNFNSGVREPVLNLDHNDKFTDKVKKALKVVGLGFVSSLRKNGKKLIADFKEVPVKLAELIQAGSLKKRSSEFFTKGYEAGGKVYDNVLTAVSFFGHDAPAINTLNNDFEVVFDALMQMDDHKLKNDTIEKTKILHKEKAKMDTIEIKKEEYQELLKLKSANEVLETKLSTVNDENEGLKSKVEQLTADSQELTKFKAEAEKIEQENIKKEANDYIENAIKENHIQAKFKDHYLEQYAAFRSDEKKLATFKEEIDSRKIELQGELALGGPEAPTGELDYEDSEQLENTIQSNMKKNNTSWDVEAGKLGLNIDDVVEA